MMALPAEECLPCELEEMYAGGNLRAGYILACAYDYGWYGERDNKKAVTIYRQLVRRNYAPAIANYGYALLFGIGVRKDEERGMYWTRKAADMGCVGAMSNLANMYAFANDMPHDYALAKRYARMAAQSGDSIALNTLGRMYETGRGFRQNLAKAFSHYRKAYATNPDPVIISNLVRCYRNGLGVDVNEKRADELKKEAIELQNRPF